MPDNIAAMRSFFNFSVYAAGLKAVEMTMSIPMIIRSGQTYAVSATATGGVGQITYEWRSECAGTFGDPTAAITTFTPDPGMSSYSCALSCIVKDGCGTKSSFLASEVSVIDGSSEDCYEDIYRSWSYTDACGNETMVYQNIVIRDSIAPALSISIMESRRQRAEANTSQA